MRLDHAEIFPRCAAGSQRKSKTSYRSFYYFLFLDMQTGERYEPWVGLSRADTGSYLSFDVTDYNA